MGGIQQNLTEIERSNGAMIRQKGPIQRLVIVVMGSCLLLLLSLARLLLLRQRRFQSLLQSLLLQIRGQGQSLAWIL